jgi:O-antigen/teichoic acid export membrane protein
MNVTLKLSQIIFPLISLPYITRTIGAENNGKIAFVASVVNYFCVLSQLGIPTYGIRVCAQCRDDVDELSKTVQELLFINMISCLCSYILLGICYAMSEKLREEPILLLIEAAIIFLRTLGMEWFYQSIEQYRYITIRSISLKLIALILMFIMIHEPDDYLIYGFLSILSSAGSNILK